MANVKLAFGTNDLKIFGNTDVFFGPYNNNLNKHAEEVKRVQCPRGESEKGRAPLLCS